MIAVIALRYAYVLALSVWFGGTILIGFVMSPVSDMTRHRYFVMSYAAGGCVLATLMAMALLGPRPSGFAARLGVAVAMFAGTIYAGRILHLLTPVTLGVVLACGLALLFWEARDGTRAA
jgi:hypothetical protein